MKPFKLVLILFISLILLNSCEKEAIETLTTLQEIEKTKYFDAEIFDESDLRIYGIWELLNISGGFIGSGYDLNFKYLEIKKFGVYGFVKNDSLVEYGKISPALQTPNDIRLKVDFEKDEKSNSFFTDSEKHVEYTENDTLHLNSPCCDRYSSHFKRVR